MEVRVDRDELRRPRRDGALVHVIKDGHEDKMSVVPHLMVVRMKAEQSVWKLSEVGFSIAVKLDGALIEKTASRNRWRPLRHR